MVKTSSGLRLSIADDLLVDEHNQGVLTEWGYEGTHLYHAEIPGVDSLTNWGGRYDVHQQVYTVAYKTTKDITNIVQSGTYPNPLGLVGTQHNDQHQDGTQTLYWHVRVLDYNQETGEVNHKLESVEFNIQ